MASIEGSLPRRKLATYGKAGRKAVQSPSNNAAFNNINNDPGAWDVPSDDSSQASSIRPIQTIRKSSMQRGSLVTQSTLSAKQNGMKAASSSTTMSTAPPQPSNLTTYGKISSTAVPPIEADSHPTKPDAFDVPSSDDDTRKPFRRLQTKTGKVSSGHSASSTAQSSHTESSTKGLGKKRKRVTPIVPKGGKLALFDDDALQRHIAIESAEDKPSVAFMGTITPPASSAEESLETAFSSPERPSPSQLSGRDGLVQPLQLRKISKFASRPKIPNKDVELGKGTKRPVPLTSAPKENGRRQDEQSLEITTVEPLRQQSPRAPKSFEQSRRTSQTTPKAPNHSRKISSRAISPEGGLLSMATSPVQARLWDRILPESDVSSPSQLKMRHLAISSAAKLPKPAPSLLENLVESGSLQSSSDAPKPRKRLIDALEITDKPDDQSEGESDGETQEDETMTIPEIAITTAQESQHNEIHAPKILENVPRPIQSEGPKVTYARQRSYLTESHASEQDAFAIPLDFTVESVKPQKSGPSRRVNWPLRDATNSRTESLQDDVQSTSAVRSIHELRKAGGHKRYLDEVESLLQDIDAQNNVPASRRRSALMDLVTKMDSKEYCRNFVSHGFDSRMFSLMASEQDLISLSLFAAIVAFLFSFSPPARSLFLPHQTDVAQKLSKLLEADGKIGSIAKERKYNMSKAAINRLSELFVQLQSSQLWEKSKPEAVSPCLISLKALDFVVKKSKEAHEAVQLLSSTAFEQLVDKILVFSDIEGDPAESDRQTVELCLSILESHPLLLKSASSQETQAELLLRGVSLCLYRVLNLESTDYQNIQWLALRLAINATSNKPRQFDSTVQRGLIESLTRNVLEKFDALFGCIEDKDREFARDNLIISLASLINISEWSDDMRTMIASGGEKAPGMLEKLLDIFVQRLESASQAYSMEEVESHIPFGYLAVLLGNLSLDKSLHPRILSKLPERSNRSLIESITEFLRHHQTVDSQSMDADGTGTYDGLTEKLQGLVRNLERA